MRPIAVFALCLVLAGCAKKPESPARLPATQLDCDPAAMTIELGPLPAPTGSATGVAVRTGRFQLGVVDACHYLELPLLGGEGEALATAALSAGKFERSYGIVRFDLPATITTVGQADSTFADSTIAAAYVVHGKNGRYFLDVHLAGPSRADSRPETNYGRVALKLAVGGGAIPVPAPRARNVVVMEPRDGGVTYPITVRGYARTFEANVQGWIEQNQEVVPASKSFTTAADWVGTWGEFELTIPSGPAGDIVLFVGEESAKDGTPIGVRIPLRVASETTAGGR